MRIQANPKSKRGEIFGKITRKFCFPDKQILNLKEGNISKNYEEILFYLQANPKSKKGEIFERSMSKSCFTDKQIPNIQEGIYLKEL